MRNRLRTETGRREGRWLPARVGGGWKVGRVKSQDGGKLQSAHDRPFAEFHGVPRAVSTGGDTVTPLLADAGSTSTLPRSRQRPTPAENGDCRLSGRHSGVP
jgi:hypothetical protein